jgi:hypothetical protein
VDHPPSKRIVIAIPIQEYVVTLLRKMIYSPISSSMYTCTVKRYCDNKTMLHQETCRIPALWLTPAIGTLLTISETFLG